MIPLSWYLVFAALLFCVGLFAVLTRRNAVALLMGVELMLNAVNLNLVAFWRYLWAGSERLSGPVFVVIVFVVAAAETAVALALIISAYRRRHTVVVEDLNTMRG